MCFKDASEPTDIIWENRHYSNMDYIKRQLLAFVVIFLVLTISFIIILCISNYAEKVRSVFPAIDCGGVDDMYSAEAYGEYAIDDYQYITDKEGRQADGTLQCYC